MENQIVKIKSMEHVTHDVLQIVTDKPKELVFTPGQATEVFINKAAATDFTLNFSFSQ